MRFAISLLTVIAVASVIGTVLKQNEPYTNYAFEFGPFWFEVFRGLGLYDVYHAAWFILILAFLVVSTSVCVYRNTPQMLRELRGYREHASEVSLRNFKERATFALPVDPGIADRLRAYLTAQGYRFRERAWDGPDGTRLIAAKKGSYQRVGYFLAHAAIVIICVGGLMDSNIPLKLQESFGAKRPETRDIPQSQVPAASRLGPGNLSFRGNVTIPEGGSADVVFVNAGRGYLVQELPFTVGLKKFHIEHYATGQPKSFASDLVIFDKATGESFERTIKVNHPLIHRGVAVYQASFGDGGTALDLRGWNLLSPAAEPFPVKGTVNESTRLRNGDAYLTAEFNDFRPINVENLGQAGDDGRAPAQNAMSVFGSGAASGERTKNFRNVGPNFQFKLRDPQGQAREYINYMLPVPADGRLFFMSGMRASPAEPFRYLRFPADRQGGVEGFMRLRALLLDPRAHARIAERFASAALEGDAVGETLHAKLEESTTRMLGMFAQGGYNGLAGFIERTIPKDEQAKAAETYLKILDGAAFSAYLEAQARAGQPVDAPGPDDFVFVRDSLNAVNDLFFYGAPVYLQLADYTLVQASGLQITRSPGKSVVYTGSVLLVLGVFAMFYVRERRLFLLLKPKTGELLFAMSANRKGIDFEQEVREHKARLQALTTR